LEEKREEKMKNMADKYKAVFLSDSPLKVELINKRISFNPANLIPMDDYGTIFPTLRLVDIWGIHTVDSGVLINSDRNEVILSKPLLINDSVISGNGWNIKLNDPWELVKVSSEYTLKKK
jgi:hypothetical protein